MTTLQYSLLQNQSFAIDFPIGGIVVNNVTSGFIFLRLGGE